MNIALPDIVAAYFAAEKAKDAERLSQCFEDDAVVHDEGRVYHGVAAIEAWHREANTRYRYVVDPLDGSVDGSAVVVHTRVTGNFPGGVVDLRCTFTVGDNRITSLEMAS